MKKISAVILALMVGATLSGCSTSEVGAANKPSPSATAENPYGGFPVDPPADDEIVLTVTGTETIDYTMPELEALAQVEVTISEPFVNLEQTFAGVELETLFEASGIELTDTVATIALNDYKYEDKGSAFVDSKGILALSRDGDIIAMDQGGPIRIVFPNGQEYSDFLDAWNWSLRTIEVSK